MIGVLVFGSLLIAMLVGLPVAFSIIVASLTYIISNDVPLVILAQQLVAGANSFVLLAIPLFTCT